MGIVEDLMEIWLNEVCDRLAIGCFHSHSVWDLCLNMERLLPSISLLLTCWEHQVLSVPWCHDLTKQLSHYLYFFFFYLGLTTQKGVQESVMSQVSQSYDGSHDRHGKEVHRPCSSCISSIEKSNGNSIEFSLSITEQRAVGFILAWSLAFLHLEQLSFSWAIHTYMWLIHLLLMWLHLVIIDVNQ